MKAMIIVQEGQFSIETLHHLQTCVKISYKKSFPQEKIIVMWNLIPSGCAITDRQLSQSSLVTAQVPNGTQQTVREAFLNDCFNTWKTITGQDIDHIMVAAVDSDIFKSLLKSNLERLSLSGKVRFISNMVRRFIQSKRQHNLLISNFT